MKGNSFKSCSSDDSEKVAYFYKMIKGRKDHICGINKKGTTFVVPFSERLLTVGG
ncbi:hypothetical protein NEPTK9_001203 [Candidatus Neptunochlamydia vexilliferae]|uniref:Uncharacterized protein n=1 Tax=Candidatus Neptunichlamydia vexilliferae TaxID=1651774 RepID=A0ABS0AZX5_9BACT|nr:hypothetical protein [Candidatus Neptunochlamydia vexilliferae]